MALFPQHVHRRPAPQADIVQVVQEYVPLQARGRDLQGPVPVPRREDAVVPRQPRQGVLPLLRLRRRAATCSSSSSCTRRSASRTRCGMLAQKFGVPLPEPDEGDERRAARRGAARSAAEGARGRGGVVPRAAGGAGRRARRGSSSPSAASRRRRSSSSGSASRRRRATALKARLLKQGFAQGAAAAERAGRRSATTARSSIGSGTG